MTTYPDEIYSVRAAAHILGLGNGLFATLEAQEAGDAALGFES